MQEFKGCKIVLKLHTLSRLIYGGKVVNKVVVNSRHPNREKKKSQPLHFFFNLMKKLSSFRRRLFRILQYDHDTQNSSINDNPKRPAGGDAREAHIPSRTQLAAL